MIFPDWGAAPESTDVEGALPLFQEWAVDWDRHAFALRNGKPYLVGGNEALAIWCTRALHPESARFCYTAWSPDYGNELRSLLGASADEGILESQLRRQIRQALEVSPYIQSVDGFSFHRTDSLMEVRFTVHTVYEAFSHTWEVTLT